MKPDEPERASLKKINAKNKKEYESIISEYHDFLKISRTPSESVASAKAILDKNGFKEYPAQGTTGFYLLNEDATNLAAVKFGTVEVTKGIHIIGAHVDSPCLTGKIKPVREKPEGVALDCYPYGGIYAHQWFDTAVNVIGECYKNGKRIVFELPGMINDATIHLSAAERTQKVYKEAFEPESLDVFIGFENKKQFLEHMKSTYDIEESDFARTMLTAVPRGEPYKISDLYYAGFGQDDKVCSFAQLHALLEASPKKTSLIMFFDREEIGSTGYNGAHSKFLEHAIDAIMTQAGIEISDVQLRRILAQSHMVSADVDVAYNSHDANYSQEESASKFGDGLIMDRNNGGAYQSMGNNVPMTRVDKYMELFKKHDIDFKVSAIPPKVNTGGGGTISMYFAHRGIPVVDMGIAVLNMHGKRSIIFLPDLYQMTQGFKVFLESTF